MVLIVGLQLVCADVDPELRGLGVCQGDGADRIPSDSSAARPAHTELIRCDRRTQQSTSAQVTLYRTPAQETAALSFIWKIMWTRFNFKRKKTLKVIYLGHINSALTCFDILVRVVLNSFFCTISIVSNFMLLFTNIKSLMKSLKRNQAFFLWQS